MTLLPLPKPLNWPFGDLDMWCHDVIVADVPANFELWGHISTKAAAGQYGCLPDEEIAKFPVSLLAKPDCLLLYWTQGWAIATGRAQAIVRAWGAEPVTELVWLKTTINGKRHTGTGYRARTRHEPILLAKWGNPKHEPFPSDFPGVARRHSEKPVEFDRMVIKHTPGQVRCNLFSAGIIRPGFFGWGEDHRTEEAQASHGTRIGTPEPQQQPWFGQTIS